MVPHSKPPAQWSAQQHTLHQAHHNSLPLRPCPRTRRAPPRLGWCRGRGRAQGGSGRDCAAGSGGWPAASGALASGCGSTKLWRPRRRSSWSYKNSADPPLILPARPPAHKSGALASGCGSRLRRSLGALGAARPLAAAWRPRPHALVEGLDRHVPIGHNSDVLGRTRLGTNTHPPADLGTGAIVPGQAVAVGHM
jgi:hypothetical protein